MIQKTVLKSFRLLCTACAGLMAISSTIQADFVIYRLPGTKFTVLLEGTTKGVGHGTFEYTHPSLGTLVFSRESALIIKAPTKTQEYRRLWNQARQIPSFEAYILAARFAIKNGMLDEFKECCYAAYKIQPEHPTMLRLLEARKKIKQPLGQWDKCEKELRESIPLTNMQIAQSKHYLLLHDTGSTKVGRQRQTRAQSRLELLEKVYESYFMNFALEGVVLDTPNEPMKVVLFGHQQDYDSYTQQRDPSLIGALGYWSAQDNVAVFFDQGTTQRMKALEEHAQDLQKNKLRARGTPQAKESAYLANTVELLVKLTRQGDDIEVVSHEATHQLAGNSGIMPRNKVALRWAHEGLATYFETSSDALWGGIGAVNENRLKSYHRICSDPRRDDIALLVCDGLFDLAANQQEEADGYGYAWGLTHFLMERRFKDLIGYYRKISAIDSSSQNITRGDLVKIFSDSFGDLDLLESQWHAYMRDLKTDLDRAKLNQPQ
jgi:hypothetical protein